MAMIRSHPRLADAAFALVLAAVLGRVMLADGRTPVAGWVVTGVLLLMLVWRRRWPVPVFWSVIVLAFATAIANVLVPALLVVPMIAAYTVARHGPRRHLWLAATPIVPFVALWLWHRAPFWDAVTVSVLFGGCLMLGLTLQTRQAYLAEVEERARRLEREREQQAQLAIAAERERIAREMHDIVAHNLAVMVALADGAQADAEKAPDLLEKVSVTGRQALSEVRRLVGLLRESELPGFDDIDGLVSQVRAAGQDVRLSTEGEPATDPGAGLAAYRIVQEALTNTMKHAGPQATATVRVRHDKDGVELEIVDDGPPAKTGTGNGLAGMRERAAAYGGGVEAGPLAGGGWRVHAWLRT
jgi:signal transduction histidine kinase